MRCPIGKCHCSESCSWFVSIVFTFLTFCSTYRKLLIRLLERRGHQCDEAGNGVEALAKIFVKNGSSCLYDCILLDSEMDQMSGPECVKVVRQRGLEGILIIGITGNVLPEDIASFKKSGANEVLSKPVKIDEIQNIWKEWGMLY